MTTQHSIPIFIVESSAYIHQKPLSLAKDLELPLGGSCPSGLQKCQTGSSGSGHVWYFDTQDHSPVLSRNQWARSCSHKEVPKRDVSFKRRAWRYWWRALLFCTGNRVFFHLDYLGSSSKGSRWNWLNIKASSIDCQSWWFQPLTEEQTSIDQLFGKATVSYLWKGVW